MELDMNLSAEWVGIGIVFLGWVYTHGRQSRVIEGLLESQKDLSTEIDRVKRDSINHLYNLHRAQERELSELRPLSQSITSLQAAVGRLDGDSRAQGQEIVSLKTQIQSMDESLKEHRSDFKRFAHEMRNAFSSIQLKFEESSE